MKEEDSSGQSPSPIRADIGPVISSSPRPARGFFMAPASLGVLRPLLLAGAPGDGGFFVLL